MTKLGALMTERQGYVAMLLVLGIGWGTTQPWGKIATTTGHGPFGLILWQLVVCVIVLGAICLPRGTSASATLLSTEPARLRLAPLDPSILAMLLRHMFLLTLLLHPQTLSLGGNLQKLPCFFQLSCD